jgi:hypothetical protein
LGRRRAPRPNSPNLGASLPRAAGSMTVPQLRVTALPNLPPHLQLQALPFQPFQLLPRSSCLLRKLGLTKCKPRLKPNFEKRLVPC